MNLRTIMIFPEFNNMEVIDKIRAQYDPLAKLVRPHITIGKMSERRELDEAYNKVKNLSETFCTIINKVSVEMIGDNEESIIVTEIALS